MNKKGQTLVLFILFIPLFIIIGALIIDSGIIIKEKIRLENITKMVINDYYYEKDEINIENNIKDIFKKNNIKTDNLIIEHNNTYLIIKNNYYINSIFGKIIKLEKYNIKVSYKGYLDNEIIRIEKE